MSVHLHQADSVEVEWFHPDPRGEPVPEGGPLGGVVWPEPFGGQSRDDVRHEGSNRVGDATRSGSHSPVSPTRTTMWELTIPGPPLL